MRTLIDAETFGRNLRRVQEKTSPSQIEEFNRCPRRWYNGWVLGLKPPATPAMTRGTAIHLEVEHYLLNGEVRDSEWVALITAAIPHLPAAGASVEQAIERPTFDGGPLLGGRYDAVDFTPNTWILGEPPAPLVADCKTTSDFRYAKTPAELADNIQLNAYAMHVFDVVDGDRVALRHIYLRTRGKAVVMPVTAIVTRAQAEDRWSRTVAIVAEMQAWAEKAPEAADALPPNTESCGLYGGCPYRNLCGLEGGVAMFQLRRNETMSAPTNGTSSLLEKLKAQEAALLAERAAKGEAQAADEPATSVVPASRLATPQPNPEEVIAAQQKIGAGILRLDPSGQVVTREGADSGWIMRHLTPAESAAFATGARAATSPPVAVQPAVTRPAVVPPDAPPRTNQPGDVVDAKKPRKSKAAPTISIKFECEECGAKYEASAGHACAVASEAPVASVSTTTAPTPPAVVTKLTPPIMTKAPAATGPIVYVNCMPVKGGHRGAGVLFEEWLAPIAEAVAAEKGVPDWRMIQYTAKGDLSAAIRKSIATLPPVLLVSSFSPAADVFLESIIPWASEIVRGL